MRLKEIYLIEWGTFGRVAYTTKAEADKAFEHLKTECHNPKMSKVELIDIYCGD